MLRLRIINVILTGVGVLFFAALYLYVTNASRDFERRVSDFAIAHVQIKIDDYIDKARQGQAARRLSELVGKLSQPLGAKAQTVRKARTLDAATIIRDIIAVACEQDCDPESVAETRTGRSYAALRTVFAGRFAALETTVRARHAQAMTDLRAEMQIFSLSNLES